jgi:hypothetical protein
MLIEFSATFGQLADADHAYARYAKAVVYDYPYDRFHADLYGKDFDVRNLQGTTDSNAHEDALAASLVAYWHQLDSWRNQQIKTLVDERGLEIEKPLWVMLGLTVLGKQKTDDTAYQSDIIETLTFIAKLLADSGVTLERQLDRLKGDVGQAMLPASAWIALKNSTNLAERILREVFHWATGAVLRLRVLKRSEGEVGLGISLGDHVKFFGVVNVGNADGLREALKSRAIVVENDVLTPSLFAELAHKQSEVHVLIGSRRFSEGWNNYRASTLTLLRLGQSQGPLIIQMFGRVVRFWGQNRSGKRLSSPPEVLRPLQTAYVFGLHADYMNAFLKTLHDNGIEDKVKEFPTEKMASEKIARLVHLGTQEPRKTDFRVPLVDGTAWFSKIGLVEYASLTGVQTVTMRNGQAQTGTADLSQPITEEFINLIDFLDFDAIYRRILDYRAAQGWWNLTFDKSQLKTALKQGAYTVEGDDRMVKPHSREDLRRLEGVAVSLLQKMMQRAYRQEEAKKVCYRPAALSEKNELVLEKVFVREAG